MVAVNLRIPEDLKGLIDTVQRTLENYILEHNEWYRKFEQGNTDAETEAKLKEIQTKIHGLGQEQVKLVARIRSEVQAHETHLQSNGIKQAYTEKTSSLNQALSTANSGASNAAARSRKQNIISRTPSNNSTSAVSKVSTPEVSPVPSGSSSPEPSPNLSVSIDDLSQDRFLKYFHLCTHDVHQEMQKKRVERKRRSTANPQFFYGTKAWDFPKRKRGGYLISNVSPPNTRQSAKRAKTERGNTPPSKETSRGSSPVEAAPKLYLPNLPNGLIIEPVNPNRASPDSKICVICRQTSGTLSFCESCRNGFHISCHNQDMKEEPPRKCPRCLTSQDIRTVCGALTVPSGMSVFLSTNISEKLQEKQKLAEDHKNLVEELGKLQEQHDHLAVLLKDQKVAQDKVTTTHHSTQDKIDNLVHFIKKMSSRSKSPASPLTQQPLLEAAITVTSS